MSSNLHCSVPRNGPIQAMSADAGTLKNMAHIGARIRPGQKERLHDVKCVSNASPSPVGVQGPFPESIQKDLEAFFASQAKRERVPAGTHTLSKILMSRVATPVEVHLLPKAPLELADDISDAESRSVCCFRALGCQLSQEPTIQYFSCGP